MRRVRKLLEDIGADGTPFEGGQPEPIYTPVGLNFGVDSSHDIATSIVAAVLVVHDDREPVHLAERERPIHDRADLEVPGCE